MSQTIQQSQYPYTEPTEEANVDNVPITPHYFEPHDAPASQWQSSGWTIKDILCHTGVDGRTYQGYNPGEYLLPNDGKEQDRLDFIHACWKAVLSDRLFAAPINSPEFVLDIGTGTGIWALDFARENPASFVFGTDLSLIQPVPDVLNCQSFIENSEKQNWLFMNKFDYIYLRSMGPCFDDMRTVLRRCYDNMNPGAYIELQDGCWELGCINHTSLGTGLERWIKLLNDGARAIGRDMTKMKAFKQQLQELGFRDVQERIYPIALGRWPANQRMKLAGMYLARAIFISMEPYKNFLMAAGLSGQDADVLIDQVKCELMDPNIHCYMPAYVVFARKPLPEEVDVFKSSPVAGAQ